MAAIPTEHGKGSQAHKKVEKPEGDGNGGYTRRIAVPVKEDKLRKPTVGKGALRNGRFPKANSLNGIMQEG